MPAFGSRPDYDDTVVETQQAEPAVEARPPLSLTEERPALRIARLPRPAVSQEEIDAEAPPAQELPVFEGGESLSDLAPEDVVMSDEERAEATRLLDEQLAAEDERAWAEHERIMNDLPGKGAFTRQEPERRPYSRTVACLLPECPWELELPPMSTSLVSAMGLGPGVREMEQAQLLEQALEHHLGGHSLEEWVNAVLHYRDKATSALKDRVLAPGRQGQVLAATPDGILFQDAPQPPLTNVGVAYPEGVIPGPVQRDPARAAAVAAVDARLRGGGLPAPSPEEAMDRDAFLRARRAARRAAPKPPPAKRTPRFDGDPLGQKSGVVTLKY